MNSQIKTENIELVVETEIKEEPASDPEYSIDNLPPLIENDVKSEIESHPQGTSESTQSKSTQNTQIKTVDDKIASSFGKFTQVSVFSGLFLALVDLTFQITLELSIKIRGNGSKGMGGPFYIS